MSRLSEYDGLKGMRSRVCLPFADDDPKTAEVVAKVRCSRGTS